MKRALKTILILAAATVAWLALGASPAQAADPTAEACFTAKINGARAAAGKQRLSTRSDLVAIARRHSQRMANSGTIYHNGNLTGEAPDDWQSLGENVGMGPTCDEIHTAFMNSSSHRRNILDPVFNFVGVGVVIASDGTLFVTEVFMQASQPAPSQPAPTSSQPKSSTSTPKASAPRTRSSGAAARPPSPPPPPPPAPPPAGSKVVGQTKAYFDRIEKEPAPSVEELAELQLLLKEQSLTAAAELREQARLAEEERGLFSRLGTLLAAVLSGSV